MTTNLLRRRGLWCAAGLATGLVVSTSAAVQPHEGGKQDPDKVQLHGDFDQPLGGGKQGGERRRDREGMRQGQARQTTIVSMTGEDGRQYTVRMEDGEVSAEVNGKKLPDDRLRTIDDRQGGKTVEILDEEGNVAARVPIGGMGMGGMGGPDWNRQWEDFNRRFQREFRGQIAPRGFDGGPQQRIRIAEVAPDAQPAPRVMIGITMGDVDPMLLKHFGLEGISEGIYVNSVLDDQPAAKAGVKANDIIIAINGKTPANQELLRDTLRELNPGDELTLKIIRKGENKDITLKVAERPQTEQFEAREFMPEGGDSQRWFGEARSAIQRALEQLKADPALQPDRLKAEASRALEEALAALEKAREDASQQIQSWMMPLVPSPPEAPAPPDVIMGPGQSQIFRIPGVSGAITQKVDSLDRKLADIDSKLKALDKRLDELNSTLEKK